MLFAAMLSVAAMVACVPGTSLEDGEEKIVTVLSVGDEWILSPNWDVAAQHLVFLPLAEATLEGERRGLLARSWRRTPDYREWTIELRDDVVWHDGEPFTAADVAFTLELQERERVESGLDPTVEVEVLDDTSYIVRYARVPTTHPVSTWNAIYPEHLLGGLDLDELRSSDFWTAPVGTGPYRYVRHVPETMMELEANPAWFGEPPDIERVILKFAPRDASGLPELLSRNVDILPWARPESVVLVQDEPDIDVHVGLEAYWRRAIVWNQEHPPFADVRVRRALTLALDRRELHRALDLPDGLPLTDTIYSERLFLRGQVPPPLPYDPEEAVRLLEEAGWHDTDGDGVREKDGMELRFVVPGNEPEAVWIQARLREVGAAMEIRPMPNSRRLLRTGEFEALITNLASGGAGGPGALVGEDSAIGYDDPVVDELLGRIALELDPEARDALYREAMPLVQADLPVTMLAPQVAFTLAHRRVQGFDGINPMYVTGNLHRLRVMNEDDAKDR